MPKHWYDEAAALESDDPIDARICASKKPYFMIYRYPELRSRYLAFQKACTRKGKMLFPHTGDMDKAETDSEAAEDFRIWCDKLNPVQYGRGVMNRICKVCEDYFAKLSMEDAKEPFDPSILKTGVDYSTRTRDQIAVLYQEYMDALRDCVITTNTDDDLVNQRELLVEDFRSQCYLVSPSEIELCDIIVDICYQKERSKQFAWDICGDQIVRNVVRNNGGFIAWPKSSARGEVIFDGKQFKIEKLQIEEEMEY